MRFLPKQELLSFEEIIRIMTILASLGISKVRLTGGEPFLRTGLINLIRSIVQIPGIQELHITTNGVLIGNHIDELVELGVKSINLSLDTLDRERFIEITRKDLLRETLLTLERLRESPIKIKVNSVVMDGKNIPDIIPMAELAREDDIDVRFIEEMPFNGDSSREVSLTWNSVRIRDHLLSAFPLMTKTPDPAFSTAMHYAIPGFKGRIGIIPAFSRTFCGSCNRIRITSQGMLKTCLYDNGVFNLRDLLRTGATDDEVINQLRVSINQRPKDGFEAEAKRKSSPVYESMSTIGG